MKAASGELNLTVITLIAIAAVLAFFWAMWPQIQNTINDQWGDISGNTRNNTDHGLTGSIQNYVFEIR